jgi:trehalose 6-phosphate phosphatase
VQQSSNIENYCLFLDVDGTLLDLAPRPQDVVVPDTLRDDLAEADRLCDGALALVSGRTIEDLDSLFAPLKLRAAGVHGAEVRYEPEGSVERDGDEALPEEAWLALQPLLERFPGTFAENKRFAFALHYRPDVHDVIKLQAALSDYLADFNDLIILPGRWIFEIKRRSHQKGFAIVRFMQRQPFRGRVPVFLGDDTTDEPGFAAVMAMQGRAYSVGKEVAGLTGSFVAPSQVRQWLGDIANSARITA